jgi:hypothetical protein
VSALTGLAALTVIAVLNRAAIADRGGDGSDQSAPVPPEPLRMF